MRRVIGRCGLELREKSFGNRTGYRPSRWPMGNHTEHEPSMQTAAPAEPAKKPQTKPGAPAPQDVDKIVAAGGAPTVKTAWTINYAKTLGKKGAVGARNPDTALYINELKVAPDGVGAEPADPVTYGGVALSKSGAAHLGSFAHAKGQGGTVSGVVGYGKRPSFEITIDGADNGSKSAAKKKHKAIVKELAARADDFVDDQEAQAALDEIVLQNFPDGNVTATVKPLLKGITYTNTTDLKYAPVNQDKTFRLKVGAPVTTTNGSTSSSETTQSEDSEGREDSSGESSTTDVTIASEQEKERTNHIENQISSALTSLAEKISSDDHSFVMKNGWSHNNKNHTETKFNTKAKIDGGAEAGGALDWLIKPKLSVSVDTDTSVNTTVTAETVHGYSTEDLVKNSKTERGTLANDVRSSLKDTVIESMRSKIATAVKTSFTVQKSKKESGASKDSKSTTRTTTRGRVDVVATDVQPHLEEE